MGASNSNLPTEIASQEPGLAPVHVQGVPAAALLRRALDAAPIVRASWMPPDVEEVAAWLPQFRIDSMLGHGGMGAVYKGEQITLERPVAIKLLPAELAADAVFFARFQREAKVLARLQHPHIVAVHDSGQTSSGHPYFVMEYVDGTDLECLIRLADPSPDYAMDLVAQICEGLQYAHAQGVIHRDIKPANVLITQEGKAKLADFGLALPIVGEGPQLTQSRVVMGTPDYMAPEQHKGQADRRSDIYAVGVLFHEMLSGECPNGASVLSRYRERVDVRLDRVITKALQYEPERRYQTAGELKADIDVIRAKPLAIAGSRERTTIKNIIWIGAIAVLLLLVASVWHQLGTTATKVPLKPQTAEGPAPPPNAAAQKPLSTGDPPVETRTNPSAKAF